MALSVRRCKVPRPDEEAVETGAQLVKLYEGSRDIAVGISGFGSAKVPASRWDVLYDMTGRTVYVLEYDAQSLPSYAPLGIYLAKLAASWRAARLGAEEAVDVLSEALRRWLEEDRDVLVVGFSLGAWVTWTALREQPDERLDMVLIAGAVVDRPDAWDGVSGLGSFVNVYSNVDAVLWGLYPLGSGLAQTPAAGLGPLSIEGDNVVSLDMTDVIGRKHVLSSEQLDRVEAAALSASMVEDEGRLPDVFNVSAGLSTLQAERLSRWMVGSWLRPVYERALDGDHQALRMAVALDRWAEDPERMDALLLVADAYRRIEFQRPWYGGRAKAELESLLELWLGRYGPMGPDVRRICTG